ncbi:MAG: Na+/H+ antiporter subunit E [Candidatus Omnitrophota bacterium]
MRPDKINSRIILFIVAFLTWCVLNWPPDWQHLLVGFFVAAFVTYMIGDLYVSVPSIFKQPQRYWYFAAHYLPLFILECIKANIDVAYRVLHPQLPIKPGIVRIKTKLKTDTGLTFLANTITLTPGTMCVDIDRDRGILYIHWIHVDAQEAEKATQLIAGKFETILAKIFG